MVSPVSLRVTRIPLRAAPSATEHGLSELSHSVRLPPARACWPSPGCGDTRRGLALSTAFQADDPSQTSRIPAHPSRFPLPAKSRRTRAGPPRLLGAHSPPPESGPPRSLPRHVSRRSLTSLAASALLLPPRGAALCDIGQSLPPFPGNTLPPPRPWTSRHPCPLPLPATPLLQPPRPSLSSWATRHPTSTGGDPPPPFMAWLAPEAGSNAALVQYLRRLGLIARDRVVDAMLKVDRGLFVAPGHRATAYADSPQPIGFNATISAPHMHAQCLELLEPFLSPGCHALDVGSGSGYLTACFALLVGESGKAVGVEHIAELAKISVDNISSCEEVRPLLESGVLEIHAGDGRKGWREHAPYKAIHVGAAAERVPDDLIEQLDVGGRMVIPVGTYFQDLRVIDKLQNGALREFSAADVRYVPLTDRELQLRGA